MDIMLGIIMGIKDWFCGEGDAYVSPTQQVIGKSEEKKDPEITFESDKEVLEKCRYVKIGNQVIGYLVTKDGKWEWLQIKQECVLSYNIDIIKQLSMEKMIAITEKLKELNGCSDVRVETAKLEQRLMRLESTNIINLTYEQHINITKEINETRKRLYDITHNGYAREKAKTYK